MKQFIFSLIFLSFIFTANSQNTYNIIPEPVQLTKNKGHFIIDKKTTFLTNSKEINEFASLFVKRINAVSNLNRKIAVTKTELNFDKNDTNSVWFLLSSDKVLGKEGYKITVSQTKIVIEANENVGFFNALQTLYQLLPPQIYASTVSPNIKWIIPCCEIYDYPRFAYRGAHLDICRHFFPVSFVKKYIDLLAIHKINYFHWHLTDDQGWRIEIKQYPKLTQIGGMRKETLIGHYSDNVIQQFDGKPYGGYYTQDEIREVVEYAKSKYITIVPEIELPGHALAALSAYPEYSCTGGPHEAACTWGVFDDVFCSKEETFVFLQNVMNEVMDLFPSSPYIHIGGDESPKVRWKSCQNCQKRIKELGLKDEHQLQSYFIGRISSYLISKGRKVIAWDEALEGGLPEGVIIMSWQGEKGGFEAAKQKHQAIMTPSSYLYFNFYQGDPTNEPTAFGGFTTLQKVYNYEPIPQGLTSEEEKYIIGTQANLWTEYIDSEKLVEYMAYPRIAALSEVAWSKKENRNWNHFLKKMDEQTVRYDILGLNYAKSHYNLNSITEWNSSLKKPQLRLETPCKDCKIHYTLNGLTPTIKSPIFKNPIVLKQEKTQLKATAFLNGTPASSIFNQTYTVSKSTGKKYTLNHPNPEYTGGSPLALTDGLLADETSWDKWVGVHGNDLDIILDLTEPIDIKEIKLNYLNNPASWIFIPLNTEISFSLDGKSFQNTMVKDLKTSAVEERKVINVTFEQNQPIKARYIKVHADAVKKCPETHPGAGFPAHLFIDEITVK